jgi:hypothetical protein
LHLSICVWTFCGAQAEDLGRVAIDQRQVDNGFLIDDSSETRDITIYNAATGKYALQVGLIWWALGMGLAFVYFVFLYRMFRGKVRSEEGHGY